MICAVEFFDRERVVLVGHNPPVVFAVPASRLGQLRKKPDGHYDRDELIALAADGHAAHYNEEVLRDILDALPIIVHGCPPRL
jgi:hypothetical protein